MLRATACFALLVLAAAACGGLDPNSTESTEGPGSALAPCTRDAECEDGLVCHPTLDAAGEPTRPVCIDPQDEALAPPPPIPGVNYYCYLSGGVGWCQDYYSQKWCTDDTFYSTVAKGWDWTNCQWRGWNADGTRYCDHGWSWNSYHYHCPA